MKKEQVVTTIQQAVDALDDHVASVSVPESGPMSRKQLEFFREQLLDMLKCIQENRQSLSTRTMMGKIIIDSWPLNSILGEMIIKAEQNFWDYNQLSKRKS
ncbi:MAG: hypothetical protein KatS3mg047_1471 [Bellilinea sp.]|nr:MAG: hypothetical protein KatS3mg047_1471 [Bellilinea sp.]